MTQATNIEQQREEALQRSGVKRGTTQRGGRPKKALAPGTRTQIGLHVGAEIKRLLDNAMEQSGRTRSQEAELRLEMSFHTERILDDALKFKFGSRLAGLLMVLGYVLKETGRFAAFASDGSLVAEDNWLLSPFAYNKAVANVALVLEGLRPPDDDKSAGADFSAEFIADQMLYALRDGAGRGGRLGEFIHAWRPALGELAGPHVRRVYERGDGEEGDNAR